MDNILEAKISKSTHNSEKELTIQNMFQMLSLELGGDGEIITKNQLSTYVKEAQDGIIDISFKETEALSDFQNSWDSISLGKNSITYEKMKDYADILLSAIEGGCFNVNESEMIPISVDDIDSYFVETTLNNSDVNEPDSSLNLMLDSFIEVEENSNIDIVQALNDLLAASN